MNSFSWGKGSFIFSINFLAGTFVALVFELNEIPQMKIQPEIITPVQIKTGVGERLNVRCKEKPQKGSKMDQFSQEVMELNSQLSMCPVKSEEKQCRVYKRKLKKIINQLEKVERELRQGKFFETESVHNLLYIENCVRY